MNNSLLQFWNEAQLEIAPYTHPRDVEWIKSRQTQANISSYEEYVTALKHGSISETAFHLNLLPQPYFGDLNNADILLLLVNPGLSACDYYTEYNVPEFRKDLLDTIRQDRKSHMFLDPKWAWTSGFSWWERKLRDVAQRIAKEQFNGNYGEALASLSCRVASVELVPYHSLRFGNPIALESTKAALAFASTAAESKTVIVLRGANMWRLLGNEGVINYKGGHARRASLGIKTDGGRAILRKYGIEESKA